ncbi:hypothetical protein [Poriferisphaera sp. WC338]|uniref:hypothetical protein n=1 Tax=Poriferisphaera sp. WC338 TaxID=3425129 RepID=UPI003D81BE90
MNKTLKTVLAVSALSIASIGMTGCGTMTPELLTTGRTPSQEHYKNSRIMDNNTRTAWDDAARIFFLDHNMAGTPYPMP